MRRTTATRPPLPRPSPLARAIAAAFLFTGGPLMWTAHAAGALPTGLQVVSGQASASTQGNQLTVKNTAGAILNWQSFSIGAGNAVWFEQANAASKVLNRVTGNDPSLILGRLASNGQVWLLNPNGVLFGAGARVDVAGLVASTLRLNDNDFLAGRYRFSAAEGDQGVVRNEGALSTTFGGQIVLVGARVENTGDATAPGGAVTLAAATSVELVDTGLPNLAVRVDKTAGEALNLGRLVADGGRVDVYGTIVNQQGWVQADTLRADASGQVTLRASDTLTLGEASVTRAVGTAAGSAGGQIDLLGSQVALTGRATVDASGDAGGGRIRLGGGDQGQDRSMPNARAVWFGPEATLRADATGKVGSGGRIVLWSDSATRAYGTLSARGGSQVGDGGFVETSGGWLDARPAAVDVSSRRGSAGQWLLDPNDITINDAGPDTNIAGGPNFGSTNDGSVLSTATIAAALNVGTSVVVSTGNGGSNLQAGDIVVDGAHLLVNPSAAVSLNLSAWRDVIVRNSTLTSTGQPLSLNLTSATGPVGAIEIANSTITTAGGNVTLRGALQRQVLLPGGQLSAASYPVALGYDATQQAVVSKLATPGIGVDIIQSQFALGAGAFTAYGVSSSTAQGGGLYISGTTYAAGGTSLSAASISLYGWAIRPIGNYGVVLGGNTTEIVATQSFTAIGNSLGSTGFEIDFGAQIKLNAPGNAGATLVIEGHSASDIGVALYDGSGANAYSRGTPVTALGGAVSITGTSLGAGPGLRAESGNLLGDTLPAAPTLDLAGAASLQMLGSTSGGNALQFRRVSILGPASGSTLFSATGGPLDAEQLNLVAGGTATFQSSYSVISFSNLLAGANPLNLAFETTGASTRGLRLWNSTLVTGGGDVRFGAVQNLNSVALGNTTVAAPWLVATSSDPAYNGNSIQAALWLEGSTVDAGSGRIHGGGAGTATAVDQMAGITIDTSVLNAREITLAGRSESESGINVYLSSLTATRVLSLDALTLTDGWLSLSVGQGSRLRLTDPTSSIGSGLTLSAQHIGRGEALGIAGGDLGSNLETTVSVDGGFLHLSGSIANPTNANNVIAVELSGAAAQPGGLLINATAATEVTLDAFNGGTNGTALLARYMNFLGPQASAGSTFDITSKGGRTSGSAPTQFNTVSLSSAGTLTVLSDGLSVTNSRLVGDNGLQLFTDTTSGTARAGAGVLVTGSELTTSTAGALLRISGSGNDPVVRGTNALNGGTGVMLTNSTLKSGGGIEVIARGADAGGNGIDFTGSSFTADSLVMSGTALVSGHGVVSDGGAGSTLNLRGLTIAGISADDPQAPSHAGVYLGDGVTLALAGRGDVMLVGDSIVLGGAGVQPLVASGDAATFTLSSTGSQRLRGVTLDFSSGAGTAVSLLADTGSVGSGRVRIDDSAIFTGGGSLIVDGSGALTLDGQGQALPQNPLVRPGGAGVLLVGDNTLDAGGGSIDLTGRASGQGGWGLLVGGGTTTLNGNAVGLSGDGGLLGIGIDVGVSTADSLLHVNAGSLVVDGRGGTDSSSGDALPGLSLQGASEWNAGSIAISTQNALTLSGVVFSAAGNLTLVAGGDGVNGSLLSAQGSTLSAGGALRLQGTATNGTGFGVSLLDGVNLTAPTIEIAGTGSGSFGVNFLASDTPGLLDAGAGRIDITGRRDNGQTGVNLGQGYVLRAAQASVDSEAGIATPGAAAATGFDVSDRLTLLLQGGALLGPGGGVETAGLAQAVASMPATATVSISAIGGPLQVSGTLDIAPRLQLNGDGAVWLEPGALLRSASAGDAVVIRGAGNFIADPAAVLATPNGRWVLLLPEPDLAALGALSPAFTAYGLGTQPWATDASGNLLTPAAGNAVGWNVAVATLAGALTGQLLSKVYDATTAVTLNPATWVLGGLLPGDTLALVGNATGNTADKNVGAARPVTLGGGTSFAVTDAGGHPVYGYAAPAFSVDVTPASATIVGAQVAGKVYDATNVATLSSLGTAQVLAGDVVGVGGVVNATFVDKNVGVGKAVAVAGLALTGADAGNYTLLAPGGFTADITPRALAVAGLAAQDKVYDTTASVTLVGAAGIAPLAGDAVALVGAASGSFADKNVGAGKAVTVAGLALGGADLGNYTLVLPAGLTASITSAPLVVSGLNALSRTYDGSTAAPLAGAAAIAPLAGDAVALVGAASGSFATKNVGVGKAVTVSGLALGGADATNYQIVLPTTLTADVTPAVLALQGVSAANKVYDGGTTATLAGALGGLFAGDTVTLSLTGQFADGNAGVGKTVNYGGALGGADAANYALPVNSGSVLATITPATLTYLATPTTGTVGQALPALTGTLAGFVAGETQASATTGALLWTTAATSASPTGAYAVTGGGLAAANYQFVQAAGNASALTLASPATSDPVTTATTVVTTGALFSVQLPVTMSTPTQGRVLDVTPALASNAVAATAGRSTEGGSAASGAPASPAATDAPSAAPAPGTAVTASAGAAPDAPTASATTAPSGPLGTPAPAPAGGPDPAALLGETLTALTASTSSASGGVSFDAMDWSRLSRDEVQTLLAARARYKQQVFSRGVYRLQQDPSLADVRACRTEAELQTGDCVITEQLKAAIQGERARLAATQAHPTDGRRRVKTAALPAIERKLAVLIGVNDYRDAVVPRLQGAIPDARAVRDLLEGRLGYETTVLENPSREAIVRALNRVALDAGPNDSVIVYYAGHGVLVPVDGVDTGFWLPADVDASEPKTWLANADIGKLIAAIGARQVMLVSDSCYSGSLAGRERVQVASAGDADDMLKRRAAVVMSSGGEEPVADEGRNGHSIFAWHFMQALQGLDQWQIGGSLYERVRTAVLRDFPQTPQYGASRNAGHQVNTDYLFERREFDTPVKP